MQKQSQLYHWTILPIASNHYLQRSRGPRNKTGLARFSSMVKVFVPFAVIDWPPQLNLRTLTALRISMHRSMCSETMCKICPNHLNGFIFSSCSKYCTIESSTFLPTSGLPKKCATYSPSTAKIKDSGGFSSKDIFWNRQCCCCVHSACYQ